METVRVEEWEKGGRERVGVERVRKETEKRGREQNEKKRERHGEEEMERQ